jgi:Uma2 family endonuclease
METLELEQPRIVRHKLTVEQYHRMGEAGVFEPGARVELIEGEVIDMAPIGSRHGAAVSRLTRLLVQATGERAIVSVQMSVRLDRLSEPEPDLALLKPRDDFYAGALPTGRDTLLVIEVADSSLAYDLHTKSRLYALHGVPVYWIVDLPAGLLHTFAQPQGEAYTVGKVIAKPGRLALASLDDISVDLGSLFSA